MGTVQADMQTGDTRTDAEIQSAQQKLASGQPLSQKDSIALMAGAAQAAGVAAGVPGVGPIFAAMLVGEIALVAGADALFKLLGIHAGAGPGTCVDPGPPSGPSDPRWHSGANQYGPITNEFEALAVPVLIKMYEVVNNCGPIVPGVTEETLLKQMVRLQNSTHAGPSVFYPGPQKWGGEPPFFLAVPPEGISVNVGPAVGRTQQASGRALDVLFQSPEDARAPVLSTVTDKPLSTGAKVAIGVASAGAVGGAAFAVWRFWPAWRRIFA